MVQRACRNPTMLNWIKASIVPPQHDARLCHFVPRIANRLAHVSQPNDVGFVSRNTVWYNCGTGFLMPPLQFGARGKMGFESDRSNHAPANRSIASESDAGTREPVPQNDRPTVRIICDHSGNLQLDYSKQGPEYSRRIAEKLVHAKVSPGKWKNYKCRNSAVVQFVSADGTSVGPSQPVREIQVNLLVKQKTVCGILIRDPQGTDGEKIKVPKVGDDEPHSSKDRDRNAQTASSTLGPTVKSIETNVTSRLGLKPLANWGKMKTSSNTENTRKPTAAKRLPDAASSVARVFPLPNRVAGEPPSWAFDRTKDGASEFAANTWGIGATKEKKEEWSWMNPSRVAEQQLQELLEKRNGELHIRRQRNNERRRKNREPLLEGPTWIDSFFRIAKQKFGKLNTPLCRLTEVYLRPDYLAAPHADKKSATMAVDHVVELLMDARKSGKSALRKLAAELLVRGQYKEIERVEVAGATRKKLDQLANKLADPKTSLSDGLQIIMQDLGDSIRFEYNQMRRNGNEREKISSIGKCRSALAQAEKSKAFRNCTAEQREELKGVINGWDDRLTSYVNTNQMRPTRK